MKIATLLIVLVLMQAQASEPYPETVDVRAFPVAHWQLTMVEREQMVDTEFEFMSRSSCIKQGIEWMREALVKDQFGGIVPWLGFVCEYVES